jgi:uncharacterized protein (TIGR02246 family)
MRHSRVFAIILGMLMVAPAAPWIAAQSSPKGTDADTAAIQQLFASFYGAFSRHDAHATAMTFAEDADFTNMRGVHRKGRKEIETWFTGLFTGNLRESTRTDTVRGIRFFSPDVAVADADTVITGTKAADGSVTPPRHGVMIVTAVKQDGRWWIATFHESEFPETRPAPNSGPAAKP